MAIYKGTVGIIGREAFYDTIKKEVSNNPRYSCFEYIYFQDLFDDAYKQINQLVDKIDVFISGPRHYQFISSWFPEKPVVKIKPVSFDILEALKEAAEIDNNIYILSPYNFNDLTNFKNIFRSDLNIFQNIFTDIKDLRRSFQYVVERGGKAVVGGSLVCNIANEYGLTAFHYYSKETIKQTIDNAINLMLIKLEQKAIHEKMRKVVDFSDVGLIVVDNKGDIEFTNSHAIRLLGRTNSNTLGFNIDKITPYNTLKSIDNENKILVINGTEVLCDKVIANDESMIYRFQEVTRVEKAGQEIRKQALLKLKKAKYNFSEIVGGGLTSTIDIAKSYATSSDANVLIIGPTGSGKELFASSIHNSSSRAQKPFVPINCAALPENLLESELFGYEAGSFTGANKQGKRGLIELAHQGTLFLDEIAELPYSLQAKMLRVLQEKEVLHVGGEDLIPIDIRVIAATNRSLEEYISEGRFRADLYYRLSSLILEIPPLSVRRHDVFELVDYFLRFKDVPSITSEIIKSVILDYYKEYDWPGNVREIQNILERVVTYIKYTNKQQATAKELSKDLHDMLDTFENMCKISEIKDYRKGKFQQLSIERFKTENANNDIRNALEAALEAAGGNKTKAAKLLGVSRSTLWRWCNEKMG